MRHARDVRDENHARDLVDLRRLQLCAAALDYDTEASAFDLQLAAARYAEAVDILRRFQRARREETLR